MDSQIYTTWLPLALMVVFGIIGLWRGAAREAVVAASVVLGAFINSLWSQQWTEGVHELISDMDSGQQEFALVTGVLWLVVLGLGYGLGTVLPKEKPAGPSRTGGLLLGLASGAAMAGLMLRYAFAFLENANTSSPIYQDPVSYYFMVWAAWFPIVLAVAGAVVVLVGPLRRSQQAVSQPSASSDWSTGARVDAAPPETPAPAMASSVYQGAPVLGTAAAGAATAYADTSTQQVMTPPPQDVWMSTPQSQTPALPPQDAQVTGASGAVSPSAASVSNAETDAGTYSSFNQSGGSDSSWLLQPTTESSEEQPPSGAGPAQTVAMTSFGTQRPIASSGGTEQAAEVSGADGGRACPSCGAQAAPGASFCTECGTRLG